MYDLFSTYNITLHPYHSMGSHRCWVCLAENLRFRNVGCDPSVQIIRILPLMYLTNTCIVFIGRLY